MTPAAATAAPVDRGLADELHASLGQAGLQSAQRRARGCARPVRLHGSTVRVNATTGEVLGTVYGSAQELDGTTYVRCGNRRASVCPSCSHEYKGDAWHLVVCGLAGGKGVPESVAGHPMVFATLTAPSFGAVHGQRGDKPCRARRDRPTCRHGRPAWCLARHREDDPRLGEPLCWECYDYEGHVLWQWHAPELWRRFTIALGRTLAHRAGLSSAEFRRRGRVGYFKVAEFQARGVVHVHAPIRLDGPNGPDSPPQLDVTADELAAAVTAAAAHVVLDVPTTSSTSGVRLRWGTQVDVSPVTSSADRDATGPDAKRHPHQVASYCGKYTTKGTEAFGLPTRVHSAHHAQAAGARPHAVRIVATAERLATAHETYGRMLACLSTLGYRGHLITKSRRYSVTFGALRHARRLWRQRPPGLDPDAQVRELLDHHDDDQADQQTGTVVGAWTFAGLGYLDLDSAAAATRSAIAARSRRHRGNQPGGLPG